MSDGLADNDIFEIFEDSKGRIWLSTYNGNLCYYYKGKFHNSTNDPYLSGNNLNSYITSVFEDINGGIWFGTYNDGVGYLNSNGKFNKISLDKFDTPSTIFKIISNNRNEILAVTQEAIVNITKNEIYHFENEGLSIGKQNNNQVRGNLIDSCTFMLTEHGNLIKFDICNFNIISKTILPEADKTAVFANILSVKKIMCYCRTHDAATSNSTDGANTFPKMYNINGFQNY